MTCHTCGADTGRGARYCSALCAIEGGQLNTRPARTHAIAPTQRGYDGAWRKVRREVLDRDDWLCQVRIAPKCWPDLSDAPYGYATVDHIIELTGPDDPRRLDPDNLRACCKPCNSARAGMNTTAKRREARL